MATSNNPITKGLSGRFQQIVFRQRYGKTIICKRPRKPATIDPSQYAIRENFKNACIYAKSAIVNPSLKLFYAARAKLGQSAYNVAVAEFYTLDIIHEIDSSAYNAKEGGAIMVTIAKSFAIASVYVRITGNSSLIEEGPSGRLTAGLGWVYISNGAKPTIKAKKIQVTVTDMEGRLITKIKTI